ncbi:MAG: hypothetical protein R3F60_16610 [bacterium]
MPDVLRTQLPRHAVQSPRHGRAVVVFDITSPTVDRLALLAPDPETVDLIHGLLGRAQQKFPQLEIYTFFVLPDEIRWLMGVPRLRDKSLVLEWLNREIAKRINKLRRDPGPC